MSTTKDGGSAFPKHWAEEVPPDGRLYQFSYGGMSLRDYFAKGAMEALIASRWEIINSESVHHIAATAHMIADAMLAARAKEKP